MRLDSTTALKVATAGAAVGLAWAWLHPGTAWGETIGIVFDYAKPGRSTKSMGALNPAFRTRLDALFDDMRREGFHPGVRETWRDATRQAFYHSIGWSQVDYSYHMATRPDGSPDSLAADTYDERSLTDDDAAAYFRKLRDLAPFHGLQTGGTFGQSDPRWAAYGLGWDPGHVEPMGFSISSAQKGLRPWGTS